MKEQVEPELDTYLENFRNCAYCDDIFIAHHGLQQYCQSKNGKANYCKNKHKALVSEKRLADRIIELETARSKTLEISPLDKNIQGIQKIIGDAKEKITSSDILDSLDYNPIHYTSRESINGSDRFLVRVGNFFLEWIGQNESVSIFKITRS